MKSKEQTQTQKPKDLGIKIGTKDEEAWTAILGKVKLDIEQAKREIIINEAIQIKVEEMIKKEKSLYTSKKTE